MFLVVCFWPYVSGRKFILNECASASRDLPALALALGLRFVDLGTSNESDPNTDR
jgi:hypothetical protein